MTNQSEKPEELRDSLGNTLKQLLIDIPKMLKGIYSISVGIGGLLLFVYFVSINYIPIFDLSSALWIPVFIACIGLLVVVFLGFVFVFPGWMLNIFVDDIKDTDEREKLLKFLNFEDSNCKQKLLAFCFFAMPWLITFLSLVVFLYIPKDFFLIRWIGDISCFFLVIPLILIPLLWERLFLLKGLDFKKKKLFGLSFIFCLWVFVITFLSIPLSFASKHPINNELFVVIYLFFTYTLCGFATWAIGCSKDKQKFLKIVLFIVIMFPMISLFVADKLNLMVNTPMQIFNLGRTPIELKVNRQYSENVNKILSAKGVVIHDGIIKGSLLTRLGADYVIEVSNDEFCKNCHSNKKNIIIPIPKEKVEATVLTNLW